MIRAVGFVVIVAGGLVALAAAGWLRLDALDPVLAGYLALFLAGFVVAEIIRPALALLNTPLRFVGVVAVTAGAGLAIDGFVRSDDSLLARWGIDPGLARPAATAALTRAPGGLWRGVAEIGAGRFAVVLDSGEPLTLISPTDARAAGIPPDAYGPPRMVLRDLGGVRVAPVRLDAVRIGEVVVRDVPAGVTLDADPKSVVLGMSFIDRLDGLSLREGRLVLRK